ncbi:hypothetical protein [Pseudanabaena sp. FACHB-2040]|uniref:hypothetical protein n=1 Tax=Pseudanabaena sp. FACHB-2040 TaxID=2692859 RepID=UPI0016870D80|nr:hypothetical protein [Pseudanabaena sp. FACHB-2040]MBD2259918.1 hypothetical protein [Pseudanabaena sp. FACHB-2040]
MSENTNCEKLATVLNTASQQGKAGFVKMVWDNQSADVQSQLRPLLSAEALQALDAASAP